MNDELILEKIEAEILEGKRLGVSANEIILNLQRFIPDKIIYIEKPTIKTEEEKEYYKEYRKMKKELDKIKSKEDLEKQKIEKALTREKGFCFYCKKIQPVINPTHEIKIKRNSKKKTIIILSECPICNNLIKSYGGLI